MELCRLGAETVASQDLMEIQARRDPPEASIQRHVTTLDAVAVEDIRTAN